MRQPYHDMEIRKHILFFHFFVLYFLLDVGDDHLATEFVVSSTATSETSELAYANPHMTRLIEEQFNATVKLCSGMRHHVGIHAKLPVHD